MSFCADCKRDDAVVSQLKVKRKPLATKIKQAKSSKIKPSKVKQSQFLVIAKIKIPNLASAKFSQKHFLVAILIWL